MGLALFASGLGINALIGGSVGMGGFWILFISGLVCAVAAFRQRLVRSGETSASAGLSQEARVLRLIVLILIAAALIFGAIKLKQSVNRETENTYGSGGINSQIMR